MTDKTLNLIHEKYQEALISSHSFLEIIETLFRLLAEVEVPEEDEDWFYSFIDGIRGCRKYRRKTNVITNFLTCVEMTLGAIINWLNATQGLDLDVIWKARRKSLSSDFRKILKKSPEKTSSTIRDRFALQGIECSDDNSISIEKVYIIFEAILDILGGKNLKVQNSFIEWYSKTASDDDVTFLDKNIISTILEIPFAVENIKDYIKDPKPNGYQALQFTMTVQVYSKTLPGCQFEIQLRTKEMHKNADHGTAAHTKYKEGDDNDIFLQKINKVFVIDKETIPLLNITAFDCLDTLDDTDGITIPKQFVDRHIAPYLMPSDSK